MAYRDIRDSKPFKVFVIVVCVILALAMTIPAVATLLSKAGAPVSTAQTTSTEQTQASIIPDANTSLEDANAYYQKLIDDVAAKVEADKTNPSNYRMLGNNYASWAENLETYHADDPATPALVADCWAKAAESFKASLDITYNDPVAYNYAYALHESGDNDAALATLEELVENAPNYTNAWALLSHMYEEMGETEKADEAYTKALELSGAVVSAPAEAQADADDSEGESED